MVSLPEKNVSEQNSALTVLPEQPVHLSHPVCPGCRPLLKHNPSQPRPRAGCSPASHSALRPHTRCAIPPPTKRSSNELTGPTSLDSPRRSPAITREDAHPRGLEAKPALKRKSSVSNSEITLSGHGSTHFSENHHKNHKQGD